MITAEEFLNVEFPNQTMFGEFTNNWTRWQVKRAMLLFARQCCLETAKNTRYKAIDIIQDQVEVEYPDPGCAMMHIIQLDDVIKDIQNISNQDVLPKFE